MHNTADRKSIRAAEKQAKQNDLVRGEFICWMMGSTNGRQWVNNLLIDCHLFRNPMTDSDRWTSFALGEMNVGQKILADIMEFCPEQYVTMQRENHERSLSRSNNPDGSSSTEYFGGEDGGWDTQGSVDNDNGGDIGRD